MILTVMTKSGEAHVKIDHVVAIVKQGAFVENEYVTPSQHTLSLIYTCRVGRFLLCQIQPKKILK